MTRAVLYEAATVLLAEWCGFGTEGWAMGVAKRQGIRKARVALARKLSVVLHRMRVDGKDFRWSKEAVVPAA